MDEDYNFEGEDLESIENMEVGEGLTEENNFDTGALPELASFDLGATNQESYSAEMFRFLSEIIRSEWKHEIIEHIKALPLTLQYKEALLSTITELLSIPEVLANNDKRMTRKGTVYPMNGVILDAELRLIMTQTCADADDLTILNSWLMESNVLANYKAYISRTQGGRERERNNLFIKQQQISSSESLNATEAVEAQKSKKGGLFGLFGGR